VAEAAAARAGAQRAVEREQHRLGPDRGCPAVRALPALAALLERPLAAAELEPPLAAPEGLLGAVREPRALGAPPGEAVGHHQHLPRATREPGRPEQGLHALRGRLALELHELPAQ